MSLSVTLLTLPPPHSLPLEIVERKGLGHPDTICDAVAEAFSRGLSHFYQERFGRILHHNVDKALLCGGVARPAFGGGELLEPIEIHLAGRATCEYRGIRIPVEDIAIGSARRWLRENLSHLDADAHVRIVPHVRPTSPDLSDLFDRAQSFEAALANDTSFGVGFGPLDTLESTVLAVARDLNAPETRAVHPYIGEDIKVMGARLEAAAGKNPVSHVGKLYNVMAHRVAHAIVAEVPGAQEAYCYLLSRIGDPITDPCLFDVQVRLEEPQRLEGLRLQITDVAQAAFAGLGSMWRDSIDGTLQLW